MRGKLKWIIGAIVAIVVAIPVGTFVYIHFIEGDPPAKLTLESGPSTTTTAAAAPTTGATSSAAPSSSSTTAAAAASAPTDISGTYAPTLASQVGYRVKEN